MSAPACFPAVAVRRGADPDVLRAVRQPGVAAALWERAPDPGFAAWIDALPAARLPRLRALLDASRARDAIAAACDSAGLPVGPERDCLADDAAALAALFAGIARTSLIRLRLDVIETDGCRKFHVDNTPLRLLCAYRGAGTEFGVAASLAPAGGAPDRVERAPRAAALALRGLLWPGEPPALLHRSPPMGARPEPRLLLVIDPA